MPHIAKKIGKVTERTNNILDTLPTPPTSIYTRLKNLSPYVVNASEPICMMMIM